MPHLGDEIAVLDGLDLGGLDMAPVDGRIGQRPATGAEYARRAAHNIELRRKVIDPSEGANYGGGSSYAPRLPLMPSSVGLADADLVDYARVVNVLPPRKGVIDPGGGALYSGGSNYAPGMPLVTSGDPGLAASLIQGGYGRAGLGAARGPLMDGGYGSAGMGAYDTYDDYEGVPLGALDAFFGSTISIEDGRIGRKPATGAEYARRAAHNVETRRDVIDPSEGANYGGGSSYASRMPLMPSSIGLAELGEADELDGMLDQFFLPRLSSIQRAAFKRAAGVSRLKRLKGKARKIQRAMAQMTPARQARARMMLSRIGQALGRVRGIRRQIAGARAPRPPVAGAFRRMRAA